LAGYGFRSVDFIGQYYDPQELVVAGPGRRLAGYLIDNILLFPARFLAWFAFFAALFTFGFSLILLPFAFLLTLPWLIWFAFVAPNGQTPGKQLLSMYIIKANGTRAGGAYTWFRELIIKFFAVSLIDIPTFGLFSLFGALWCLWDKDNQCLWDKLAGTYVGYSPNGVRPLTDRELLEQGRPLPVPGGGGGGFRGAPGTPVVVINNQVGNGNFQGQLGPVLAVSGRIGLIDQGVKQADARIEPGRGVVLGRGPEAQLRLSDRRVSGKHLQIEIDGSQWKIRDLDSTNPAQVIAGDMKGYYIERSPIRMASGQLRIGQSVITLYPITDQRA
jgi:uncharacterized RDD family membrane protein YckC